VDWKAESEQLDPAHVTENKQGNRAMPPNNSFDYDFLHVLKCHGLYSTGLANMG